MADNKLKERWIECCGANQPAKQPAALIPTQPKQRQCRHMRLVDPGRLSSTTCSWGAAPSRPIAGSRRSHGASNASSSHALTPQRNRWFADSPLERAVYCELVSEVKFRCRFRQG